MSAILVFCFFFFFNDTATTEIYTLSLHTLFRSPRHEAGCVHAPLFPGRTAPAAERAAWRDVPHRPAPAAARGGRAVRRGRVPPAGRQAGPHRPLAGQRPQRPALGGGGPPGPAVRRE